MDALGVYGTVDSVRRARTNRTDPSRRREIGMPEVGEFVRRRQMTVRPAKSSERREGSFACGSLGR
jgi:hypothetical protein